MKYSKYPSYRDSGVEWLGKVPKEWNIKPFWTLYKRDKKTGYPNEMLLSVYRDYGVIQKSSRDDNNNKASEDLSAYQLVNPSDLAMNKMKAWQGSLGVSEYKGIVSPAYFIFESLHNQYDQYLHHLMRSPRYIAGYLSMSKGIRVNQWDLDPQYHSRMPIILPSLQEQQTIANYLDKATAKIDTLIAKQTRLIELLKEKRQAVISTAVTRGLDSTVAMKDSGVEWLGEIPEGWTRKKLNDIAEQYKNSFVDGPFGSDLKSNEYKTSGTPLIQLNNIKEGRHILKNMKYITDEKKKQLNRHIARQGDIVIAKMADPVARATIVDKNYEEYVIVADCVRLTPNNKKINSSFLIYAINSQRVRTGAELVSTGTTRIRINLTELKKLWIPYPEIREQQTIANYLDEKTQKIDNLITKATKAIDLLKEKRTALISSAVTGKIDVREIA